MRHIVLNVSVVACLTAAVICRPPLARAETGSTVTGTSRTMNPAISVNGLFLGTWEERTVEGQKNVSADLQELEIAFMSIVDPFFKASVFTAIGSPHEHTDQENKESGDSRSTAHEAGEEEEHGVEFELEEAFVRALSLPAGVGARAGKMLVPFGRTNQLHLHHLPFIQEQHAFDEVIGHGVSDIGIEASYAPLAPWYLNFVFFAGDGATDLFDAHNREFSYAGRIENLWDLSEATTFEIAGSVLTGPGLEDKRRNFYGADARIKWKDPRKSYGSEFEWMTELIVDSPDKDEGHTVLDSRVRYKFSRSWWAGFGHSMLRTECEEYCHACLVEPGAYAATQESDGGADSDYENTHEIKGQIAFTPSEFSAIRLDVTYLDRPDEDGVFKVELQLNFTIGSHPAHLY